MRLQILLWQIIWQIKQCMECKFYWSENCCCCHIRSGTCFDGQNINAQERDKVTKVLRSLNCKVYDSQTNFILFKAPIDNMEVYAKLEEQDVLIGAPIGMNRVSLGNPEMNEKFIKIMKEILS